MFDDQVVSFGELRTAFDRNWQGPDDQRLRRLAQAAIKFGNDDDYADSSVACVYESYLEPLPGYRNDRYGKGPIGGGYTISTSNISWNVPYGMDVGATPDGRLAGEPLNEGASACRGADRLGPTALAKSLSKLPNQPMAGGQSFNMRFTPGLLDRDENLNKSVSFLQAFNQLGGFHVQINVANRAALLEARAHPDRHPDRMVRVAGSCALFTPLMPEVQDDIIARTEHVGL